MKKEELYACEINITNERILESIPPFLLLVQSYRLNGTDVTFPFRVGFILRIIMLSFKSNVSRVPPREIILKSTSGSTG